MKKIKICLCIFAIMRLDKSLNYVNVKMLQGLWLPVFLS